MLWCSEDNEQQRNGVIQKGGKDWYVQVVFVDLFAWFLTCVLA